MLLLSLVITLIAEHFRPITHRVSLYAYFTRYAHYLEAFFNAGGYRHGALAWLAAVVPVVATVWAISYFLTLVHPSLSVIWNALILYLTLGFKHFSDSTTAIAAALRAQDLTLARKLTSRWHNRPTDELSANEIARLSVERTLIYAHRHLFGIMAWFLLLGPAGAVLYRLAHVLNQLWSTLDTKQYGAIGVFAGRTFEFMDWFPARLTAASFAIVGNFEDAIYCWRYQAPTWSQMRLGILLASGAGAIGVRLGEALTYSGKTEYRPQLGLGELADADFLESAISLIWRALLLWLAAMLLIYLGYWLGTRSP